MVSDLAPSRTFPPSLTVSLPPDGAIAGTVRLPGSKSITNRALLIGALARGETLIENALFCEDSRYLVKAVRQLGVAVEENEAGARLGVKGAGGPFKVLSGEFFLGNAGTSTRFLTAALALSPGSYTVDGDARMRERPIGDLVRALSDLGAEVAAPSGCPPVTIGRKPGGTRPPSVLAGGRVVMSGRTSSQFISAVLMAAPLARRDVEIIIDGECVSRPYIDVTVEVMRQFGAAPESFARRSDGRLVFLAPAGRGYRSARYLVEGDASTASYFLAAAAITGGKIRVEGVGRMSIQGDARFANVLASMGCRVKQEADAIGLAGDLLHGVEADCGEMPDIVPTLAVVALFARGRTRIRNVAHLRFKESDRIASVAAELRKLGGRVKELKDGLEIEESELRRACLETWGDHRLAMALSLAGLRVDGVEIREPAVVEKSFPGFFDALQQVGAEVRA
jgi:3-phosphoshikimate 1-carboxyvinyltransferase